ncbi:hypothetical protein [Rathayibacter rathayi]|uniref:hypothetical protein n=2 Tax=Rathayibacter rathayi TaxID=33887 RepID=UPI0015E21320|nr:hypothetical protein [Rathayibacter rathayi]
MIVVTTDDNNDQEMRASTLLPPHRRIVVGEYTVYFSDEPFNVTSQVWDLFERKPPV